MEEIAFQDEACARRDEWHDEVTGHAYLTIQDATASKSLTVLGDQHLDESRGAIALFEIPGHHRKPEPGRGRDIDSIGPSDTEPPGEPGRRAITTRES